MKMNFWFQQVGRFSYVRVECFVSMIVEGIEKVMFRGLKHVSKSPPNPKIIPEKVILPYFPYNPKAKVRLEVLFKKLYPKINLVTPFFTKSYLLNTIKPFSGHENRSLGT
jgi:hypothetical protein